MKLPELPYPDADICQIVVHANVGSRYGIRINCERNYLNFYTLDREYWNNDEAQRVAAGLRQRINAVRRLMGRETKFLAVDSK